MSIIGKTIGALGNLTFVLVIIIFIFAVMGMQVNEMKISREFFTLINSYSVRNIFKNLVKICLDGIFLIFFMHLCKYISILIYSIRRISIYQGSFFEYYVANGLNQCGIVLNVLVGHVYHFFYLHSSSEILWFD
jgi:hypothetical protein